jgi:hypothetical protein
VVFLLVTAIFIDSKIESKYSSWSRGVDDMYAPMEVLLELLKSTKLADRKKAIDELHSWNEQLVMEDALTLLELAGQIWPISDEEWDDPSHALVKAACVFIHDDMIPTLEKNLVKYSYQTINFVLSLLIINQSDTAKKLYKKVFSQIYFQSDFIPSYDERNVIFEHKESTLTAIEVLIENNLTLHPWYEWYYHYLVVIGLEKQYITSTEVPIEKDFITGKLQSFFDRYLEYHQDYKRTYVYEAWKVPYYQLRFYLKNYLTLYSTYCSEEELLNLQNILEWKDNIIRLDYIETLWKRNLSNHAIEQTVQEILVSNEGTHQAYTILKKYKPEFLPTDSTFQTYFVKETADFLFYNSSEGFEKFPTEVEIMGSFQENDQLYGDNLTYYVVRFKSADNQGWMRMLIGAYYTHNIPTPWHPTELEDGYTDFLPWDSKNYEEHVEDFRKYLVGKHGEAKQDEVFYQSTPTYDRHNNLVVLPFLFSFGLLWASDWFIIGLIFPPIWILLKYLHAKRLEKNILVQIRGYYLDYFYFDDPTCVTLNQISKIHYEKRTVAKRERFFFIPLKTWHYILYDYEDKEIYVIPGSSLIEDYFIPTLQSRTAHLSQPPVLTWEDE